MTNKIAGLYLNLAKALNALEEAGEEIFPDDLDRRVDLVGDTGTIRYDHEIDRWGVVQA